jgi:hypothetical protein
VIFKLHLNNHIIYTLLFIDLEYPKLLYSMGALISVLSERPAEEIFIDLENAHPTNAEIPLFSRVESVLSQGQEAYDRLLSYQGCTEIAGKALSNPSIENERNAFRSLLENVEKIAFFFQFSRAIETIVPDLLLTLSVPPEDMKNSLQTQQALAKQFADLLNLALKFDEIRMQRPFLSNDFSYYRRFLPKFASSSSNDSNGDDFQIHIKEEEASGMALFTAEYQPIMTAMTKAVHSACDRNEHVIQALAVMANVCMSMMKNKKFASAQTQLFCARAMVGAIVLYDHVDSNGAFTKRSPIHVKSAVILLKKEFPQSCQPMLNALQYSTRHFKDASATTQELFPK